jgi:hypothetical protein
MSARPAETALADNRPGGPSGSNTRGPIKRPSGSVNSIQGAGVAAGRSSPMSLPPVERGKPPSHSGYYDTVRPPSTGAQAPRGPRSKIGGGVNSGVYSKVGNASGLNTRVAAPAARSTPGTRAMPTRPVSRTSMLLNCASCGKALPAESLSGKGKLVCAECVELSKKRLAAQQRTLKLIAAAAAVALIVAGILLPQQAMFMVLLAGLGLLALAIIGAGWPRVARLGLFSAGLIALAVGGMGLGALQQKESEARAQSLLQSERKDVGEHLKKDEYLDAQRSLDALQTKIREHPTDYDPKDATAAVTALQSDVDQWIESRYPGLPPEGRALLESLMRSYPDIPGTGRRIQALKIDDQQIHLAMISDALNAPPPEKNSPPMNDPRVMEVRSIMLFLFDSMPSLKSATLDLGTGSGGDFKTASTVTLTREDVGSLRLGNLPPALMPNR